MHRREPAVVPLQPRDRPMRTESLFALALAWRASGGSVSPFRDPAGFTGTAPRDEDQDPPPDPPLAA